MRSRHPNKEIEAAILYAEGKGWRYKAPGKSSHAWGRMLCKFAQVGGCMMSIWTTPKDNDTHAKQIRKKVDSCPH